MDQGTVPLVRKKGTAVIPLSRMDRGDAPVPMWLLLLMMSLLLLSDSR